jgi:hypothetical protein
MLRLGAGCCAEAWRMAGANIAAANRKSRRFMNVPERLGFENLNSVHADETTGRWKSQKSS